MRNARWDVVVCVIVLAITFQSDAAIPSGTNPDIDGMVVVWTDDETICWDDLTDPNVPRSISSETSTKPDFCAISASNFVWESGASSSTKDLEGYNLLQLDYLDLLLDSRRRRYPDISGNRIVWQDYRNGDADIYLYDIASEMEQPVYTDGQESWSQIYPAIDGDRVVWMDNRGSQPGTTGSYQIYLCDLSQTPCTPVAVNPTGYAQWYPAVSGDLVVWSEDRGDGNGYDIFGYDLSNTQGGPFWIFENSTEYDGLGEQNRPAVSGNWVVWQDSFDAVDEDGYAVRAYDRNTGRIQTVCNDGGKQWYPAISGRTVVWQENTSGINYTVLPVAKNLTLTSPEPDAMFVAGGEMDIVWTAGGTIEQIKIEFQPDAGAEWQTLEPNVPAGMDYRWSPIADVNSNQCQIRVSDFSDSEIADTLDGAFTIFQCDENLTADITGDCFVGLDDFAELASQWLICGNPYDQTWCHN